MGKNSACFLLTLLLVSCGPEPQNRYLTYQNIVILSDMSSRLQNRPQKDTIEIHKLVQYFNNECVKPGEKIGDKSSISFSVFSERVIASIDINQIKNLADKQSFINSTGKYKNSGLKHKLEDFMNCVKNAYNSIRNPGLDLISILVEKINNEPIIKQNTHLTDGIDTTFINYENHIYIFTDGYLEYKNKNANSQFYFGTSEIEKVRQCCTNTGLDIAEALKTNSSLCLPAYSSAKNMYICLHILETDERDKDLKLQTYKHPMGKRDNEILEAVWRKWAMESGFKSFEWKKY
jgi:hypothetical protein